MFSYLRSYKGEVVLVALNMSASPQKVNFELSKNGFSSANRLLATPKSAAQGHILSRMGCLSDSLVTESIRLSFSPPQSP